MSGYEFPANIATFFPVISFETCGVAGAVVGSIGTEIVGFPVVARLKFTFRKISGLLLGPSKLLALSTICKETVI